MNVDALVGAGALWAAIPIAMLAGLISFLSPCILPLVPGYLGFIGGAVSSRQGTDTAPSAGAPARGSLVLGVLLFIAGFTVVFVAMTILGGSLGIFFEQYRDIITRIFGVIVIVLGLVFMGAFRFFQRTARPQISNRFGLVGAPILGVVLGVGWTPCIGPTLATIMGLAWTVGDPWRAGLLGVAYSLGLGVPFLLVALGFGWAVGVVGFMRRHLRVVNIIGGSLLIAMGVLMVSGVWLTWMIQLAALMSQVVLPL